MQKKRQTDVGNKKNKSQNSIPSQQKKWAWKLDTTQSLVMKRGSHILCLKRNGTRLVQATRHGTAESDTQPK
jgi:hypothetical protein